jgi:hypothetical protein
MRAASSTAVERVVAADAARKGVVCWVDQGVDLVADELDEEER